MTLEQFFDSLAGRLVLLPLRVALHVAARLRPGGAAAVAHKFREIFSARVNRILLGALFTRSRHLGAAPCLARTLELHAALPCQVTLELKDYTQGDFYFMGWPSFTIELIHFADRDTAFFDIGANGGLVSIAMSYFLPHPHIFAFEPIPETFARLQRNFAANCPTAIAANLAISSGPGKLRMSLPSTDSGSASASSAAEDLTNLHGTETHIASREVECTTFDRYFAAEVAGRLPQVRRFAFKIDVEGHELAAIEGMTGFLSRRDIAVLLVVECRKENGAPLHRMLESCGLRPMARSKPATAIAEHHEDCLYVKEPDGAV